MPTIVTYTDARPSRNHFPRRIISPTHGGPCCGSAMEPVGPLRRQHRYEFQYRRCPICGFTVRFIVRFRLRTDAARQAKLRTEFATLFSRQRAAA